MTGFLLTVTLPTWLAIGWRRYLAKAPAMTPHEEAPRSILVVRLDQLGDLVLTTPLFRELKRLYPKTRITVVMPPQFESILTTNRHVDEVLPLHTVSAKWLPARVRQLASVLWFYRARLRYRQFDLAISPRWDVDDNLATLVCVLARATRRIGHSSRVSAAKRRLNRGFDAAFDVVVPAGLLQHEVECNLAIVRTLGGGVEDSRLEIYVAESDRRFATELLKRHDRRRLLVALGIGGRAPGRKWPLERYAQFLAQLDQQRKVQPILICSDEEDQEASALSVRLAAPPYICSGLPLRVVCAVLARCDLFVGNDSGPAHLAAAMECPTIVVSRHPLNGDPLHANSPARFAPRCERSRVLQPQSGAGECVEFCRSSVPHCILQVTAEQVVDAAIALLASPAASLADRDSRCAPKLTLVQERSLIGAAGLT